MASIKAKRVAYEGFGFGLIAGVVFLAAEMVSAAVRTGAPFMPLRWDASVLLGFHALDPSLGTTYLAGLVVHLVLSGLFGLGYAEIEYRLPSDTARRRYGLQFAVGAGYAALLWLVNVEIIAHVVFPWFLGGSPIRDLVLQALFFGGPLGLMFAAAERRTPLLIRPSTG